MAAQFLMHEYPLPKQDNNLSASGVSIVFVVYDITESLFSNQYNMTTGGRQHL